MMSFASRLKPVVAAAAALTLTVALPYTAEAKPAPAYLVWDGPQTLAPISPNTSTSFTATVTNRGGSTARSMTVTSSGSPYSITSNGCTGVSLRVGRSCQVTVSFSPTATGTYTGTIYASAKTASQQVLDTVGYAASALTDVTAIDVGSGHACAITTAGALKCWGSNWAGQVGNGTGNDVPLAVQVNGMTSGVTAVSAGGQFTCAIVSGAAKCWGSNWVGQLGFGAYDDQSSPVQVTGLTSGVTAIGTGDDHACAIQSGALYCWGANGSHEFGDGTTNDSPTPVLIPGMESGVTKLAVGSHHTCAVVSDVLKCWGSNGSGQVGNGATDPDTRSDDVTTPTAVANIGLISDIWLGNNFSCVLLPDGSEQCWGDDGEGQLGNGGDDSGPNSWVPVQVTDITAGVAVSITASAGHACVLVSASPSTGNEARCWGRNGDGQLGLGDTSDRFVPTQVQGMSSGVSIISAGWMHTCAVMSTAQVKCFGAGGDGQLGDGLSTDSSTAVTVLSA